MQLRIDLKGIAFKTILAISLMYAGLSSGSEGTNDLTSEVCVSLDEKTYVTESVEVGLGPEGEEKGERRYKPPWTTRF